MRPALTVRAVAPAAPPVAGRRPRDVTWLRKVARRLIRDLRRNGVVRYPSIAGRGGGGGGSGAPGAGTHEWDIEDLYRDHAAAMYRTAVSIVRDHALAEDVVQDSIVKAWRNLDRFRGDASVKTWLLRITHNTAVSTLRRLRDTPMEPADLPNRPVAGPEPGAIDDMFYDAFAEALFELDEVSRAALALRDLEELSYADIAEVLDVSLPTVKTRLFRARRHMAVSLAGWKGA